MRAAGSSDGFSDCLARGPRDYCQIDRTLGKRLIRLSEWQEWYRAPAAKRALEQQILGARRHWMASERLSSGTQGPLGIQFAS